LSAKIADIVQATPAAVPAMPTIAVIMSNKVVPKMKNAMAIAYELSAVRMAAIRFQTSLAKLSP
jgi:hypothetical protein